MKFKYPVDNPTVIIELPGNLLPNEEEFTITQIKEFTKGGSAVVYQNKPDQKYFSIKLRLTKEEKTQLIDFLKNTVQWSLHEFLWDDGESTNDKVVRFWDDRLKVKRDFLNYYIVEFKLLYVRDNIV